ncbi:MAG: hypothetical protein QOE58_1386 [Actinomycetota bacterium]|nr:hypothetical protein [Actinomycetota bacterium]
MRAASWWSRRVVPTIGTGSSPAIQLNQPKRPDGCAGWGCRSVSRPLWLDIERSQLGESQKPGAVTDQHGRDLWVSMPDHAHTDNPCAWPGSINMVNPKYVAGLPDEPRALLDRLTRDDAALQPPGSTAGADGLRNYLLTFIDLPWLTDRQRAAVIQTLGLLPGGLGAKGYETVAGHRGLLLVSESDGFRSETVVSAEAPGVLRRSLTVIDPVPAGEVHPAGRLARGTVIFSDTLVAAAVVPTTDDRAAH